MPLSLLNVIRLIVEQGFCNHIDHQHFVYTQQGILHVLCRITKRTKTNTDHIRQLKAKVIHTYLSVAQNPCLQQSFHEPLAMVRAFLHSQHQIRTSRQHSASQGLQRYKFLVFPVGMEGSIIGVGECIICTLDLSYQHGFTPSHL